MKIGFILTTYPISAKGGVKIQAEMWKVGLEKKGHVVQLLNPWETPDWQSFDAFVLFDFNSCRSFVQQLSRENSQIVMAPIIDPKVSPFVYKFFSKYWGCQKYLGLSSRFHDLWLVRNLIKMWVVRSDEEFHYVRYCLEIPENRIKKIPLHYRIPKIAEMPRKEKFCFHASRLAASNKNVARIIEAAKKFGFPLKLAGHLKGETEFNWLRSLIGDADNIEYVGEVSEDDLLDLYKRAKVFALPSLQEGVGMVALEAASYGCEIVLTSYGAPKEYYKGRAILVNPKSVDEIGAAIIRALDNGFSQPELKFFVEKNYSESEVMEVLSNCIKEMVKKRR